MTLNKNKIRFLLVYWFVFILAGVYVFFGLIRTEKQNIRELQKELNLRQQDYEKYSFLAMQSTRDRKQETYEKSLEIMNKFMVEKQTLQKIKYDISEFSDDIRSVDLSYKDKIIPKVSKDERRLCKGTIELECKCSFLAFLEFVNGLERHHPFVFIEDFTIKAPDAKDELNLVRMNLAYIKRNIDPFSREQDESETQGKEAESI